jgi:hypothetical protein
MSHQIVAEPLFHETRLDRERLPVMAEAEIRTWSCLAASNFTDYNGISRALNHTSMLLAFGSSKSDADILCRQHRNVFLSAYRKTGTLDFLLGAFQPHINLGRLAALSGNPEGALANFRLCLHAERNETVTVGDTFLTKDDWETVRREEPPALSTLAVIEVLDSLKCLIRSGWHSELQASVRDWRRRMSTATLPATDEAAIVAALLVDEPHVVAQRCHEAMIRNTVPFHEEVLHLYGALGKISVDRKSARRGLVELVDLPLQRWLEIAPASSAARFGMTLTRALQAVGLVPAARASAYCAHELATRSRDEPLIARTLTALENMGESDVHDQLARLRNDSWYQEVRKGLPMSAAQNGERESLLGRLKAAADAAILELSVRYG